MRLQLFPTLVLVLGAIIVAPMVAQEPVTAFLNVSVVPMDRERVLRGQTVIVQGDQVTALGPFGQVRVPSGVVQVDGRGKCLIPGLADRAGTIEVGKRADLVLLSDNPLTNIRNTAQQVGVMVGGRWLPREEIDRRLAEIGR